MSAESRPEGRIDRRLRLRLRLYALLALVLLVIAVVEVARGQIGAPLAALGLLGGLAVGVVASRMVRIAWDEEAGAVIGRIDWIGAAVLVVYLAFSVLRTWLLGHWVAGAALGALSLDVATGVMLGRVLGTGRGVRRVLGSLPPGPAGP